MRMLVAIAGHKHLYMHLQVLFPESYAETAGWLRKEVIANEDTLERCKAQLEHAMAAFPQLQDLVAEVQVTPHLSWQIAQLLSPPEGCRCRIGRGRALAVPCVSVDAVGFVECRW